MSSTENVKKSYNKKNIIISGVLFSIFLMFTIALGIMNMIIILGSLILPTIKLYQNIVNDNKEKLLLWNIYLGNSIIINIISSTLQFIFSAIFNTFYIKLLQLAILFILYNFRESIVSSFNGDTTKENIIIDNMILINKNRFKLLNNIIYKIIQDLYIFYHSFEMNNIVSEIEKGLEFYLDSKNTGNEDNEYDKVKTT
jgi:hypothetical protein